MFCGHQDLPRLGLELAVSLLPDAVVQTRWCPAHRALSEGADVLSLPPTALLEAGSHRKGSHRWASPAQPHMPEAVVLLSALQWCGEGFKEGTW